MHYKTLLLTSLAAITTAACDGAPTEPAVSSGTQEGVAEQAPVEGPQTPSAEGDADATPNPYASGRPGQPAIPETVDDPNWQERYSTEVTYKNLGSEPIPATLGASPRTGFVGSVQPGDGVAIITCELNSTYCKVRFGADGKEGYVNMDLLSGTAM